MTPVRSRFLGNTVWLVVATVLATGLTLAQMKILAANLPLALFGLFASLRGLSLLVSMLAANGFPQLLVRFLPEQAARQARAPALRLSVTALGATVVLSAALLAGVAGFSRVFFRQVPSGDAGGPLMVWFAVTTLAVAVKLVMYGGFNGLRRFGSQTVVETLSLAAQVAWMGAVANALTLTRLFEITGVTSLAAVVVAAPWYFRALHHDTGALPSAEGPGTRADYTNYWIGALGLSLVAIAFTDADRWVLSNVLALESLSLFHVASRIARLANRFIAIPVLAFQPEATRVHAEGRPEVLELSARTFFKTNVLLAVLATAGIIVYAAPLIDLASSRDFAGARNTLWLLAASTPITAMTASITAIMKALDGIRSAFWCDLAWAIAYLAGMLTLTRWLGVEGTGVALMLACVVQALLAFRLATIRPRTGVAMATLARSLGCAVVAFAPAVAAFALHAPLPLALLLAPAAAWIYLRLARWSGILAPDERERLRQVLSGGRMSALAGWIA